jgi:hypothetical protein
VRQGALFIGWALAGAGLVLGFISVVGPFALLPAVVLIVFLSTRDDARRAAWSLLGDAGALLLYVAYYNREGPGLHCTSTGESYSCGDYPDPRPWLVIGLVLVAASIVATIVAHRR